MFIATGKLGIEGIASYTISGAREFKSETELLKRTITLRYAVAGAPVHQTVTLRLMAELEMKADTAFNATLNVKAEKYIRYGFAWSPENGFFPIKDNGFTQTTTFSLTGQANATATLKIYPVLETTLYGIATAKITVDPTLDLAASARLLPLPAELEKFNLDFSVGLQLAADLSILGKTLYKWESDRFELLKIPLFSMPEVKLIPPKAASICHPAKFFALISDGYNNAVPNGLTHVDYDIVSGSGATLMDASGGRQTSLSTMTPGEYTVRVKAWGDGPLGSIIGARYAEARVDVVDPGQDCMMVPPPSDVGPPLSCQPEAIYNGLTAPIYYSKARVRAGEAFDVIVPMRYVDLSAKVYLGFTIDYMSWSNPPKLQRTLLAQGLAPTIEGEYRVPYAFNPDFNNDTGIGTWRPYFVISCLEAFCPANPVNTNYVTYGTYFVGDCDAIFQEGGTCQMRSDYAITSYTAGPDPNDVADDSRCEVDSSGLASIPIEVVGPRTEPTDANETVDDAVDFAHGVRRKQNLQPHDVDWFRRNPPGTAGGGLFDAERPTPGCDVVVELTSDTFFGAPPELIVYRGENNAKNDTNRVVRGFSPLRFAADPTAVYFVRVRNASGGQLGDYMAEIKSDCTQSTTFPSITASPMAPVTVAVDAINGSTIQVNVPVDGLTTNVEVYLDQLGAPLSFASAYVAVTGAPTTVPVDLYIPASIVAGDYYIKVGVVAADEFSTALHKRTYGLYPGFGTSLYSERFENYVVSPNADEIRPGMIAVTSIAITVQ